MPGADAAVVLAKAIAAITAFGAGALWSLASATSFAADLPDRNIIPGTINPDITQGNIQ